MKLLGYWFDPLDESRTHYPEPQDFVDHDWLKDEKQKLVDYLTTGQVFLNYWGFSWCRFKCGLADEEMGSNELTDGVWAWPEGLAHYIEHHGVILPAEFINHARLNQWQIPSLDNEFSANDKDIDFWLEWSARPR